MKPYQCMTRQKIKSLIPGQILVPMERFPPKTRVRVIVLLICGDSTLTADSSEVSHFFPERKLSVNMYATCHK